MEPWDSLQGVVPGHSRFSCGASPILRLLPVLLHTVWRTYSSPLPCSHSIVTVAGPLPGTGLAGVGEVLKWEQVDLDPAENGAAAPAEASGRQVMDTNGTGGLLLHQLSWRCLLGAGQGPSGSHGGAGTRPRTPVTQLFQHTCMVCYRLAMGAEKSLEDP